MLQLLKGSAPGEVNMDILYPIFNGLSEWRKTVFHCTISANALQILISTEKEVHRSQHKV
jgi:hypothetical protein